MPIAAPRRWSKRTLVLTVLGLVLATAVLTVGMVGFARSIGFVTRIGAASEVLNDVTQISPDITTAGGTSVTPGANASGGAVAIPLTSRSTSTSNAPPRAATGGAPNGGNAGAALAAEVPAAAGFGGAGGVAGGGGVAGAVGAEAAVSGGGGGGGGPSGAEGVVQSLLTLLGQNTTHMCGPNTCNAGQVCCNVSCGTCVAPGATCDQTVCAGAARTPTVVRCGSGQCNDGQVCCNPSCGICAAPGETCSTQSCP